MWFTPETVRVGAKHLTSFFKVVSSSLPFRLLFQVPIIAGTSDEAVSEQLKDAPADLKKTVREKLLELQRKQKD